MLTKDQALDELAKLQATGKVTTKKLMELAAQVSLDATPGFTQGSVTVLYSGTINGVSSTDYIGEMIRQNADIRVIDKTHVGQFLADKKFNDAWKLAGGTPTELYHGSNGVLRVLRHFVWDTTLTMTPGRRARWACVQAAGRPVHMSTGRV
jgi:hypothetical protein